MADTTTQSKAIQKSEAQDIQVNNGAESTLEATPWTYRPDIDIVDNPDEYVVYADIPGSSQDQIELTVENDLLSIDAPVPMRIPNGARVHRQEYGVGHFHRRFRLDDSVNVDAVSAQYEHGVLVVRLPKRSESRRRTITISG